MENQTEIGRRRLRPRRRELIEEEEHLSESNSSGTANSMSVQRHVASTSTTGCKRPSFVLYLPCNEVEDVEPSVKEQALDLWKRTEVIIHLRKKAKTLDGEFKESVTAEIEKDLDAILEDAAKLAENVFKNSNPGNCGKGDNAGRRTED